MGGAGGGEEVPRNRTKAQWVWNCVVYKQNPWRSERMLGAAEVGLPWWKLLSLAEKVHTSR